MDEQNTISDDSKILGINLRLNEDDIWCHVLVEFVSKRQDEQENASQFKFKGNYSPQDKATEGFQEIIILDSPETDIPAPSEQEIKKKKEKKG